MPRFFFCCLTLVCLGVLAAACGDSGAANIGSPDGGDTGFGDTLITPDASTDVSVETTADTGSTVDAGDGPDCIRNAECASGVCLDGACITGVCGDGFVDDGEACDDGNLGPGDGCSPWCDWECDPGDPLACDDGNDCNGMETCHIDIFTCIPGMPLFDGRSCDDDTGTCDAGMCVPNTCGDGIVDDGEDCDGGIGCQADCTFECVTDFDCDDARICNGVEACVNNMCTRSSSEAPDGTFCGAGLECWAGSCVEVVCGNGELEFGEECDDGNDTPNDGCEADCTYSCITNGDCTGGTACGPELCDNNVCIPGFALADGSACGFGLECVAGDCIAPICGDGIVSRGEVCDDGNDDDTDGCTTACQFTCAFDAQCGDGNACNGIETCDLATHTCIAGEAPDCADESFCTVDTCDPSVGCVNALIDMDGDGQAPSYLGLGVCGIDCDDNNEFARVGLDEVCDGIDNDCDGTIDEHAPGAERWYPDCDADGFAAAGDGPVAPTWSCGPPPLIAGCSGWTLVYPREGTTDCHDFDHRVYPGQEIYFELPYSTPAGELSNDYDCNGIVERRRDSLYTGDDTCLTRPDGTCFGDSGWAGGIIAECGFATTYSTCEPVDGSCERFIHFPFQDCR